MHKQLIKEVFLDAKQSLNSVSKKRKSTQFFQKVVWLITGLYLAFMLVIMAGDYFPDLSNNYPTFLKFPESTPTDPYPSIYPLMGLIVLLYLSTSVFVLKFQQLKLEESATISKMVKRLFPGVDFSLNTKAPITEITKSKLFAWIKKDTPIYSYGQLRSHKNGVAINITDIGMIENNLSNKFADGIMKFPVLNMLVVLYQYVLKNIISNKSADNLYYTFRGMFCWMKFKKEMKGYTVVFPKTITNEAERLTSFSFREEQKVNLEDPRFNDVFNVYSTDQVEARYVLSAVLMERIIKLQESFNRPTYLSFQNQQMYFAVKNENGLFSFSPQKLETVEVIKEFAQQINLALHVADVPSFH